MKIWTPLHFEDWVSKVLAKLQNNYVIIKDNASYHFENSKRSYSNHYYQISPFLLNLFF